MRGHCLADKWFVHSLIKLTEPHTLKRTTGAQLGYNAASGRVGQCKRKRTISKPFTRRNVLLQIGAVGGLAALYQADVGIGLIPATSLATPRASLDSLPSNQRHSVIILGSGLSGLTSTYELEPAAYNCTVITASHRVGGRILTIRRGDLADEMGHPQVCQFDHHPARYFNAGPAPIPAHHRLVHHYYKMLRVPLEAFVNENRQAWVHDHWRAAHTGDQVSYHPSWREGTLSSAHFALAQINERTPVEASANA